MRKFLTIAFLLLSLTAFSQNCTVCGDWTGRYFDNATLAMTKITIRVKPNGDGGVFVRVKKSRDNYTGYEDVTKVWYDSLKPNRLDFYVTVSEYYEDGTYGNSKIGWQDYNKLRLIRRYDAEINHNEMTIYMRDRRFFSKRMYDERTEEYFWFEWSAPWIEEFELTTIKLYKDDDDW